MSQVCLLHHCERGAAQHTGSGTLRGTQAWAHLHAQCTIRSARSSSAAFFRAAHVARGRIAGVTAAVACTRRVRRPCDEAAHHQRGDRARAHTAPRDGPAVWEEFQEFLCPRSRRAAAEAQRPARRPRAARRTPRYRAVVTRATVASDSGRRHSPAQTLFLVHVLLNNARTSTSSLPWCDIQKDDDE